MTLSGYARRMLAALKRTLPPGELRIRPLVRQGIVTLEGTAAGEEQCDLALRAVRDVRGAMCLVNSIAVARATRPTPQCEPPQIRTDPNRESCPA